MKEIKKFVFIVVVLLLNAYSAYSAQLMLPFEGGSTWTCDQGNYNDPSNTANNPNPTHTENSTMKYAWDFNMGIKDSGKPVLAPAGGIVVYARNSNSEWGNLVIINYGDSTFGKVAHLNSISVSENQSIVQGQQVGTCGGTGGWDPHIHYQTQIDGSPNGASIPSTFLDSRESNGIPKEDRPYTSLNTYNPLNNFRVGKYSSGYVLENTSDYRPYSRPFAVTYFHNQGASMLGYPASNVYLLENCLGCNSYGANKVYVQDFSGGQVPSATLVMNMYVYNIRFNYLGVAYPIHGQLRDYWYQNFYALGAPVTNEYFWNYNGTRYTVQWFEPTDNNYVAVVYNPGQQSFRQCNTSTAGCPPLDQQVFDQHLNNNLGCPNGNCGVGGDGTEPADYVFNRSATAKGVDIANNYLPINETADFVNADGNAYAWLEVNNVYKSLNINFKWFNPSNAQVYEYSYISSDPPASGLVFFDWQRAYSGYDISNSTSFGQWHVDIYIDGVKVATNYFNLNSVLRIPAAPTNLRVIN